MAKTNRTSTTTPTGDALPWPEECYHEVTAVDRASLATARTAYTGLETSLRTIRRESERCPDGADIDMHLVDGALRAALVCADTLGGILEKAEDMPAIGQAARTAESLPSRAISGAELELLRSLIEGIAADCAQIRESAMSMCEAPDSAVHHSHGVQAIAERAGWRSDRCARLAGAILFRGDEYTDWASGKVEMDILKRVESEASHG